MKTLLVALLGAAALSPWLAAAQNAPFCLVTSYGQQCRFYDANLCREQAARSRGMCVANQQAAPAPATNILDLSRHVQEAGERGAALGRQQRLDREAAQAAARPQIEYNGGTIGYWILFKCQGANGTPVYTATPAVGCVVVQATAY